MGCGCKSKGKSTNAVKQVVKQNSPSPRTSGRKLIKREIK